MVNNAITKIVVTKGDYSMVAAGQELYSCPNCDNNKRARRFYNVAPGQLVAFTVSTTTLQPITVDATNIASITGDLYIGVGVDTNGDGATDDVRLLAGEKFDRCMIDEYSVSSPACGQPQVLAAYINSVQCGDVITARFEYSDNRTRSFGLTRADQEIISVSATADCSSCTDCDPQGNAEKVMCSIVDQLNGEFDYKLNDDTPYPDKKAVHTERDYKAVRLHSNWQVFCISPIGSTSDCEGCKYVNAIEDAVINGVTYSFSGNLNPANNVQTHIAQLESIANQIEASFETELGNQTGFAFVSGGGPNSCCPIQLHVVTCDDTFELHGIRDDGTSGQLTPCTDISPLENITSTATCVNCGDSKVNTFTPERGIAILVKQPDLDCGCYIDKPLPFYSRIGTLSFIKGDIGEPCPVVKAKEILAPVFPRNFGAWIKWKEYSQFPGGKGRDYREVNANQGWLRLPDNVSRANNAITHSSCDKSYCGYYLGHSMVRRPVIDKVNHYNINRLSSYVYIPSDDLNTMHSWETFLTALFADVATECNVLTAISCNVAPPTVVPASTTPAAVPSYVPSYATPSYTPNYGPAYVPSYAPNYAPSYTTPTYTPI